MIEEVIPCPHCPGTGCDRCVWGVIRQTVEASPADTQALRHNVDEAFKVPLPRVRKGKRKTISVRGTTYHRLKRWCDANGESCSGVLEKWIAEKLRGAQ